MDLKLPTAPKAPRFLTVIPARIPEQKLHTSIGNAKNAVSFRVGYSSGAVCDMAIYEWVNDAWVQRFDIPDGTKFKDLPWHVKSEENEYVFKYALSEEGTITLSADNEQDAKLKAMNTLEHTDTYYVHRKVNDINQVNGQ